MSFYNKLKRAFRQVYLLDHEDTTLTQENWFQRQPVWQIDTRMGRLVLTQPSSTLWVYALGILGCYLGGWFWQTASNDIARVFWSLGLWLWGIGALLAGTSYQALGYHLKCRGDRVLWTNWFEVTYMICQQLSINAFLVATAFTSTIGFVRVALCIMAGVLTLVYTLQTLQAAFIPKRTRLSFERMSWVSAPFVIIMLVVHTWRFLVTGLIIEVALLGVWLGLIACMWAYYFYWKTGLTERLWQRGRWFSENDVLHVTLIIWMIYITKISSGISTLTA